MLNSRVLRLTIFGALTSAVSLPALASSRLIAPLWDVYVVDENDKPVVGIAVTETHQDLSCEGKDHTETQFTDIHGHVLFHERYFVGNGAMCDVKISAKTITFSHRRGRHATIAVGDGKSDIYGQNLDHTGRIVEWVDKPERMKSRIVAHPRKPADGAIPLK